jgi:N-dimethylarginine dimethylaminohydrolase
MMMQPHILMCPPDYYGIEYEINPWMSRERPSDHDTAVRQWNGLRETLEAVGVRISLVPPVKGLPDLVFTANAAMIFGRAATLSRFRHAQRQGEEAHYERALREHGFEIRILPEGVHFEGAGDALFCGDTLFAGYLIRTNAVALQKLSGTLQYRVIPLELVDPYYYHLDTCFCPLEPGVAVYYPQAFDEYGRRVLDDLVEELIPVEGEEARRFACNAVVVGKTVITNTGCPQLHAELESRGYTPVETPLDEFAKAGGSAKCLTLRLDGEEAAAWKYHPLTPAAQTENGTA